jgi:hypothetical protein
MVPSLEIDPGSLLSRIRLMASIEKVYTPLGASCNRISCAALCYSKRMATLTIPKEFAEHRDLVAVPRESWEQFVAWQKRIKSRRTFVPTTADKKALAKARRNRARGSYLTLDELRRSLDRRG